MYMQHKLFYLYSIWIFNQNEVDLGSCLMVMQTFIKNPILLLVIFFVEIHCPTAAKEGLVKYRL